MVSFHASLLPTSKMIQDSEDSLKKRKRDGSLQPEDFLDDHRDHPPSSKTKYSKRSLLDTELHLHETPMPSEWQRCLDIKSGQIYYYNTRTHKKTSRDPRSTSPEPSKKCMMSLDLELNLPCGSSSSSDHHHHHHTTTIKHHVADNFSKSTTTTTSSNKNSTMVGGGGGGGAPSWLALEGGDQQQEMMTAVCKKCHMLVMMIKSSPSCPNCKFMHPPNQNPPNLFNRELSLLC